MESQMIAKIAIVFAGTIVAMVFTTLYGSVLLFVTGALLGIDNITAFVVQYLVCLVAGAGSSFFLMRKAWPTPPGKKDRVDQ